MNEIVASDGQYFFNTNPYGIFTCFIESFLKRSGSSMLSRQMNTNKAGTTPSPKDRRQTARRWSSPNLLQVPYQFSGQDIGLKFHSHPEQNQRHKSRNHKPKINHTVWEANKRWVTFGARGISRKSVSHLSPEQTTYVVHVCGCRLAQIVQMRIQNRKDILHRSQSPKGN